MRTRSRSSARRHVGWSTLVAGLAVGGCQSSAPPSSTVTGAARSTAAATTAPAAEHDHWTATAAPPVGQSPDALARMTAQFANTHAPTAPIDPTPRPADAGGVQFGKPTARPVDPAPPPAPAVPTDAARTASEVQPPVRPSPIRDQPTVMTAEPDPAAAVVGRPTPASDPLARRLAERVRSDPQDVVGALDLSVFGLLNDDVSMELPSTAALQPEDREIVGALVDGLANFRAAARRNPAALPAEKVAPLLRMVDRLRQQADLTVTSVTLCRRVDYFGRYEPFPSTTFPAGRENKVIVYSEVGNFRSALSAKQTWETRFGQQLSLYTAAGTLAWTEQVPDRVETSRSERHDMYLFPLVKLPASLPAGRYSLHVTTEDQIGRRVAEATTTLTLAAPAALAAAAGR